MPYRQARAAREPPHPLAALLPSGTAQRLLQVKSKEHSKQNIFIISRNTFCFFTSLLKNAFLQTKNVHIWTNIVQ